MRLLTVLSLVAMALLVAGCAFVPAHTYTEAENSTNNTFSGAEAAGSLADGSLSIKGTFDSASDVDLYKVEVGTKTSITMETFYNGKSQKDALLGISFFPLTMTTYDSSDTLLGISLLMGGVKDPVDLDTGTSYVIFDFYAAPDYDSGDYELQLQ